MTELEKALSDISVVRDQLARSVIFRGFGPQALAATGAVAAMAGVLQARFIPSPAETPQAYITLWGVTAAIAVLLIGAEAVRRARRAHSGLADEMLLAAAERFMPAGCAGVLLTLVLYRYVPDAMPLLPGLWQVLLSLGIFSACTALPHTIMLVGIWYLTTGLASVAFAQGMFAFSPWAMALPFAVGQVLAGILLHFAYRGNHGEA